MIPFPSFGIDPRTLTDEQLEQAESLYQDFMKCGFGDYVTRDLVKSIACEVFQMTGLWERISKLDYRNRVVVVRPLREGRDAEQIADFLDILEAVGNPQVEIINGDGKNIPEFDRLMLESSDSYHVYDCLSNDFAYLMERLSIVDEEDYYDSTSSDHKDPNWYHLDEYITTSFFLLRSRYSEELVCEVFHKIIDANEMDVPLSQFIPLLEDWDKFKTYPIQWSLSIARQ